MQLMRVACGSIYAGCASETRSHETYNYEEHGNSGMEKFMKLFQTRGYEMLFKNKPCHMTVFYNSNRVHSYLEYQSPMQFEKQYFDKAA